MERTDRLRCVHRAVLHNMTATGRITKTLNVRRNQTRYRFLVITTPIRWIHIGGNIALRSRNELQDRLLQLRVSISRLYPYSKRTQS